MTPRRRVQLAYGTDGLTIEVPPTATVLTPAYLPGLDDQPREVEDAVDRALGGLAAGPVAVVFPDLTRPFPHRTVLPPLLAVLRRRGAGPGRVRLLCATGTHRQATGAEMRALIGADLVDSYGTHDHDATDLDAHVEVGTVDGTPVLLDRAYVEAPTRIITGFVEPHFFAGYSGGPKAVCPGLAATQTVLEAHSPARIADPRATWTVLEGNPVHDFVRRATALAPPTLSVDVAINGDRAITAVFAGPMGDVHRAACEFVGRTAVMSIPEPFDLVVTTNAGHPLDRNLYQAVKGMAAAERIVGEGGTIICAAACVDGIPEGGNFGRLLAGAHSAADLLDVPSGQDQWEVQVLGRVLNKAAVELHADGLSDDEIRSSQLRPVADVSARVGELLAARGPDARCCVLPLGPLTVASVGAELPSGPPQAARSSRAAR